MKDNKYSFFGKIKSKLKSITQLNADPNKSIAVITYLFLAVFICLIVYICFYTLTKADNDINNSYNKREELYARTVRRGDIVLSDGSIAATSVVDSLGNETRKYPYGNLFCHAIGYVGHGNLGVERNSCFKLLISNDSVSERISNDFSGEKNIGDSVITTLNPELQKAAYDAMGDNIGAVYVSDIKTGAILALVSKPDFDPNNIDAIWDELNDDENSALINRATLGLYPPGSTFKIMTALEYMKEFDDYDNYSFDCGGEFTYEDVTISCFHKNVHGNEDFVKSFAKSCNSSFANISSKLNKKKFAATCNECLFNRVLPGPYSCKISSFGLKSDSDNGLLLQSGIGQGDVLVSPAHINFITSAIANKGMLMKPYVVERVVSNNNSVIFQNEVSEYGVLMQEKYADNLKYLMRDVVLEGTATKLADRPYEACGKTGSAEYCEDKTKSHAWFTGFAPYDDPKIAVTVICEGAGSGGEVAVPIAGAVFDAYFK